MGLLAAIGYLAKKKKGAKNTVVKELSFPSQLPYAEEEGAPGAAPPSTLTLTLTLITFLTLTLTLTLTRCRTTFGICGRRCRACRAPNRDDLRSDFEWWCGHGLEGLILGSFDPRPRAHEVNPR